MKQTLSLKLGQQLTMTPQLQQAIRLLQLSALDLQQEIQETLETNPLLELADDFPDDPTQIGEVDPTHHEEVQAVMDARVSATTENQLSDAEVSNQMDAPLSNDLPVDTNWEEVFPATSAVGPADSDFDPMANRSSDETLKEHLEWQLNLTPMSESDQIIASTIIDAIDANGMLTSNLTDLYESLAANESFLSLRDEFSVEDVEGILQQVQQFDPIGVAARDIRECLLLQIAQLPSKTPWVNEAIELIQSHLDLLGNKDYATLRRKTKFSEEALTQAMALIQTLNPRPGSAIADTASDYIVPDVVVRKDEGRWVVELNGDATPQVRINSVYEGFAKTATSSNDRAYLRDHLQEARWFLKSLQTRHDTLLKVAACIVDVQRGFLEYGPEAMKPLILADVAQAVDLHESTISRVTSRKYMSTPRGVFELKYFFSSHVGTSTGGEVSSTAIRALIQKLTAEEDPKKPLSDNKIAAILKDQNINVARRTVAKYRESLAIPPSNERKQLV